MTPAEMVAHLEAYAATYLRDANDYADQAMERGSTEFDRRAMFAMGKSEAFATAAAWVQDHLA